MQQFRPFSNVLFIQIYHACYKLVTAAEHLSGCYGHSSVYSFVTS